MRVWVSDHWSHGLSISDDGHQAYLAAPTHLIILDVSQVQARVPNPQVSESEPACLGGDEPPADHHP